MSRQQSLPLPAAVIFDMDGVIIDSEPLHRQVFRGMARELGLDASPEEHAAFTGRSPLVQWEHMARSRGMDLDPAALARDQVRRYLDLVKEPGAAQPAPGLLALLDFLAGRSVPLALASSNDREVVDTVPALLGVAHRFQVMVSGEDVAAPKPAPDIFLAAAAMLRLEPGACLVVEDAANGVAAAKAAAMTCVALRNPNSGPQDLSAADSVVASLDRIMDILSPHF